MALTLKVHGFHALAEFGTVSIRIVDEHGHGVLQSTIDGHLRGPGYYEAADDTGSAPSCDHQLSDAYDLVVEVCVDNHHPVAALVSAPHLSTVKNRKIVPRLVNSEFGAVAVSFVVSAADEQGYRQRLTALMELVDPENVGAVDDIVAAMDEPAAFSFAWQEYSNASVSLPFPERAANLAERYEDIDVSSFLANLEAAEPEEGLRLFIEQLELRHAILETEDQMPQPRVLAMIRKYELNEAEVMAGLDEAEDSEEFLSELREAFGPEPRLSDPVYAAKSRIVPPSQASATAAHDDDVDDEDEQAQHDNEHDADAHPQQQQAHDDDDDAAGAAAADDHPAADEVNVPADEDRRVEHADEADKPAAAASDGGEDGDDTMDAAAPHDDGAAASGDEAAAARVHADPEADLPVAERDDADRDAADATTPDAAAPEEDAQEQDPDAAAPEEEEAVAVAADEATATSAASLAEIAELKATVAALGQDRDAKEAELCAARESAMQDRDEAAARIEELEARVATLDEAIEGYRTANTALETQAVEDREQITQLTATVAESRERIEFLIRDSARLVQARNEPGTRIRLTVNVGATQMVIPAQTNVAIGDVRRSILQRAVRLGSLRDIEAEKRNLQLFYGSTVLFDDDTLEEMGIDGPSEILDLAENAPVNIASPTAPPGNGSPTSAGAVVPAASAAQQQQVALWMPPPGPDDESSKPVEPVEVVVHLNEDEAREIASHESLDRRLVAERERIEFDDVKADEKRAFDHTVKRVLDGARMKLIDRAAYARTEEHRSQARAAIGRIDSAVRVGMSNEALLGVARHAELTAGALDIGERDAATARARDSGPVSNSDMDVELPSEMQSRIERRRQQCVTDLKEMLETLQSRVAIRPDRLGEAEGLVSKARSYVSLSQSLSVEELQTCLRETMAFVASCRQ